jgi:hypothetical protein
VVPPAPARGVTSYDGTSWTPSTTVLRVSPLTTILLYVVAPVGGFLLIAAATLIRPSSRGARYRSGDEWDHEPLWWMGNPRGSGVAGPTVEAVPASPAAEHTARGGARGTW